jgi:hypothetical protein
LVAAAPLLELVIELRRNRPFIPKGVHRFRTFEMKAACGIEYDEASRSTETVIIEGVSIPFASAHLLWRTKQTLRDKDKVDLAFLRSVLPPTDLC